MHKGMTLKNRMTRLNIHFFPLMAYANMALTVDITEKNTGLWSTPL